MILHFQRSIYSQQRRFYQPKPREHFAHSDNSLTIKVFDVPTIKFVGPTDATTAAGDIALTKDLVFVKEPAPSNTISDMDYAAKVIITFTGSDSTATYLIYNQVPPTPAVNLNSSQPQAK